MIIDDLMTIETYFGKEAAVKSLDDLITRFGADEVGHAVINRHLELRAGLQRVYVCLTDHARSSYVAH